MVEEIKLMEKGIIEALPQISYIVDQVGFAMDWAREVQDEGTYYKTIKVATEVCKYAQKISKLNFFKAHLVVAALLMDINGVFKDPKFETFITASHSIENSLEAVTINPEAGEKYGCFRAISRQVNTLAKTNQDCFVVLMNSILVEIEDIVAGMKQAKVKAPITAEDYLRILGYAYVMQNLRLSKIELYDTSLEVVNKIDVILNNDVIY